MLLDEYLKFELETAWLPMEGESDTDCATRVHERVKAELGESYDEILKEALSFFNDFDDFLEKNSRQP